MIRIELNGQSRELPEVMTVGALLERLGVDRRVVAVELAGEVVDRDRFDHTEVSDGDRIEIVRMIGGG